MHEPLIAYIRDHSITPLTDTDIESIKAMCVNKKLRKRQFFIHEGEICRYSGFILKGALRQYSIDDNGMEQIIALKTENNWMTDWESYVKLIPSMYNIDAWEDSEILALKKEDFLKSLGSIPAISEMSCKLFENYAVATQNRVSSLRLSAEERYVKLLETNPEFFQRFPQHIIASYLGITKETLSRIRSKAVKR